MIELKTQRLKLRPFRLEDAPAAHQLFGTDEDMYRYSGWNPYATVDAAEEFIKMTLEDDDPHAHSFAIEYSGRIVGNIGAYDYEEKKDSVEVGYSIEKGSWGKGFAAEALTAVLRYLTEVEGIGTVTAWCASDNIGSRTVMERAGMTLESIESGGLKIGDITYDKLNYAYRRPR